MKRIAILLNAIIMVCTVLATPRNAKVKTVTANCEYIVNPKETHEESILNALEQAKIMAIADAFGSTMNITNFTSLSAHNDMNSSRFNSFAMSDVNGEWIETINEEVTPVFEKGMTILKVIIKGKVREIVANPIDLDMVIMANGTNPKQNHVRDNRFSVGDYFYVYFMSPVSGYMTMYLEDCTSDEKVQALLPYRGMERVMKIEADKPYIFFSRPDASPDIQHLVGRIKMNARNEIDYNRLYVMFSPNEFTKALDKENELLDTSFEDKFGNTIYRLPREIEKKAFQKWLTKTRLKDPDMQLLTTIFSIEN